MGSFCADGRTYVRTDGAKNDFFLFTYHIKEGGGGHLGTKEGARCLFEFSFCWRGIWEGRIYFKDDEYWGEELEELKNLWDKIQAVFKERIKKEFPDNVYSEK